jgi:hypothetical protein
VGSAKTEVCDCKKKVLIIRYNYSKNQVISIIQLNDESPEKSHATEELVGYKHTGK